MEIHPATGATPSVVCIASGGTVGEAVQAAKDLQAKGISMAVWNAHCLKPFDEQTTLSPRRSRFGETDRRGPVSPAAARTRPAVS